MNKQIIPIFFAIDNSYVPFIDIAIRSIMKNASKEYIYEIKVLYQGLNEEEKEHIKSLVKDNENFNIDLKYMQERIRKYNG